MAIDTATIQEQVMIDYVKQYISTNYTIKRALDHRLIKLDYTLSSTNNFLSLRVYLGETTTVIGKIYLLIKVEENIVKFDTVEKLQAIANKQLTKLVTISDSMLDLEQAIIGNYNNKLIEY